MDNNLILVRHNNELFEAVSQEGVPEGMMRVSGVIGKVGVQNRNGRVYNKANYKKHLDRLRSQLGDGVFGELEHPKGFTIDNNNISHKIEDVWFDEATDEAKGTFLILDTPKGLIAQSIIRAGGKIRPSTRATGSVDKNKNAVIEELVTIDIVGTPGFIEANMGINESKDFKSMCESVGTDVANEYKDFVENYTETFEKQYIKLCEGAESSMYYKEIKETKNQNINENSMDEKRVLELIDKVFENKFAPVIQNWISEQFAPKFRKELVEHMGDAIQKWIVEEYSPEVQKWIVEEYSPEVQNWMFNQFAPEVQNWMVEQFAPVIQKWIVEEYSPEVQNWTTKEFGTTLINFISESKKNECDGKGPEYEMTEEEQEEYDKMDEEEKAAFDKEEKKNTKKEMKESFISFIDNALNEGKNKKNESDDDDEGLSDEERDEYESKMDEEEKSKYDEMDDKKKDEYLESKKLKEQEKEKNDKKKEENDQKTNESRIVETHLSLVNAVKAKIMEAKQLPKTSNAEKLNENKTLDFVKLIPYDYKSLWESMNELQQNTVRRLAENREIVDKNTSQSFWDKLDIQEIMETKKETSKNPKSLSESYKHFGGKLSGIVGRLNS